MSLRKDNSGLFARFDNRPEIPRSTLENALSAMLKRYSPDAVLSLSIEEIIDAPDMEIRQDFERDVYEFRIR